MFAVEPSVSSKIEVRALNTALTSFYVKILGGYPTNIKKVLHRILLNSKSFYKSKKIVISNITEPMIFLDQRYDNESLSWFELLHTLCSDLNFPEKQIDFILGNVYAKESYDLWCIEHNIDKRINVIGLKNSYWLSRCIAQGYNKLFDDTPNKHLTCFIGRPRFQKNYITKWYVENIQDTLDETKVISTFLYNNVSQIDSWFNQEDNLNKIKRLPGRLEDGSHDHSNAWLNGNTTVFNKAAQQGLVDLTVDYVEHEDIKDYNHYITFKQKNLWWKEDVLSEKLFSNVLLKKPFIRLGMPHSLKIFKEWGFETFDGILFDESYDNIENFYERANFILDQVKQLLNYPFDVLYEKVKSQQVQDVINHNFNLAYEIYNKKEELVNV